MLTMGQGLLDWGVRSINVFLYNYVSFNSPRYLAFGKVVCSLRMSISQIPLPMRLDVDNTETDHDNQ